MLKKLTLLSLLFVSSSSIQAGPIVGAIAYWATKSVLYTGGCFGLVVTTPVAGPAVVASTVAGTATTVAAVETISASVGAFFTSLPTF